jgi:hypothetical protein
MLARFRTFIAIIVISGMVFFAGAASRQTPTESANAAKVQQLLQASGYQSKQYPPVAWTIDRTGSSLKSFRVILGVTGDMLIIGVSVAQKAKLRMTPEFVQLLLSFNNTLDRVKVGIDNDGDLFVRTETTIRIMDVQELKVQVEQVALSADKVYEKSSAFISPN